MPTIRPSGLGDQIHLMTAVGIAQVPQRRPDLRDFLLGTKLGDDERFDKTSEEIAVAKYREAINPIKAEEGPGPRRTASAYG